MSLSSLKFLARTLALTLGILLTQTVMLPENAWAQDTETTTTTTPDPMLDTDDCPNSVKPPAAVDSSEVPKPGQITPSDVPLPEQAPAGLDFCGTEGISAPTSAGAWIIYDIDSGDVLGAKDPNGRYRPASIIKALLAMEAIDKLPMDQVIPVSQNAQDTEGSAVGITTQGRYTTRDLLMGLILQSGNDAAIALAEAMGGVEQTRQNMQRRADELGTTSTRVGSINGLDAPGMQTTAVDMALIYQQTLTNPTFLEFAQTEQYNFPNAGEPPFYSIQNDNRLLYDYPGTLGGKTGYTSDARHTYSVGVERDGRKIGVVILNASTALGTGSAQAEKLLDAAFGTPDPQPVGNITPREPEAEPSSTPAATEENTDDSHPRNYSGFVWTGLGILIVSAVGLFNVLFQRSLNSRTKRRKTSQSTRPSQSRRR